MKSTKILLIEDNLDHAELITEVLDEENDMKVILKKDGQEAIDYFQKSNVDYGNEERSQISLVILDLNLPKIHGIDVLKFLKKDPVFCKIPVFAFSASYDDKTIGTVYGHGADGFMPKLLSYEKFVENIRLLRNYLPNTYKF